METTTSPPRRDRHDRLALTVAIVSAIISAGAVAMTRSQVLNIKENAQCQMRAYVYITMTPPFKYPQPNPDRLGLGFEIKNSGLTWARNLTIRKATIPRDLTTDYDPWTRAKWDATEFPMVLGPGQPLQLQLTALWLRDIEAIIEGKIGFDFAIWVTYLDTLTDPPLPRETRLVQRFAADKDGGFSFTYVGANNCADDDCPK
jgi:hypothetical protein